MKLLKSTNKLLKSLEWSGYQQGQGAGFMGGGGCHYPACPKCDGIKPHSGADEDFMKSAIGHKKNCGLIETMKRIKKELEK